jgi:hypothetical protein
MEKGSEAGRNKRMTEGTNEGQVFLNVIHHFVTIIRAIRNTHRFQTFAMF